MPGLGNRHADGGTMSHILDNDLVVATGLQCEFGFRQVEEAVLGWLTNESVFRGTQKSSIGTAKELQFS